MFSKNIFASRIKLLRKNKHKTQTDLAQLLDVSKTQISDIENGKTTTSIERLYALADFFDVPLDYLVGNGIFSNWEEIIERKEQVIDSLEETVPMLKELNLSKASEKQLMRILPAFIDHIEFDDDKNALIINFYA